MQVNKNCVHFLVLASMALLMLVSIAGAAPFAYITNQGDDSVSVIDTTTDTVIYTITNPPVPQPPYLSCPYGVAVSPDGIKVYVANSISSGIENNPGDVAVIDTISNSVSYVNFIPNKFSNPRSVVVSPDGKKAYFVALNPDEVDSWVVFVLNTTTGKVVGSVSIGADPYGIDVTPDGSKIYVANVEDDNVSVIDTATNKVIASLIGNSTYGIGFSTPSGVAVSPDGTKVYVTDSIYLYSFDTKTNEILDRVATGDGYLPRGIAVSPDGTKVYTVDRGYNGTFFVFDTAKHKIIKTVAVGHNPGGVAVTPDGKKVFVANEGSNNVSVIDSATNEVIDTVQVGLTPDAFGKFIVAASSQPILPPFPGYTKSPKDPNHDGFYEDINGNDHIDFDDVVAYYKNMNWITQQGLTQYFDFNKNSQIEFDDLVRLYKMVGTY